MRIELGTVSTVLRRDVGTWRRIWSSWDELVGEIEMRSEGVRYFESFGGHHAYASPWNLSGLDTG